MEDWKGTSSARLSNAVTEIVSTLHRGRRVSYRGTVDSGKQAGTPPTFFNTILLGALMVLILLLFVDAVGAGIVVEL